MNQDTKERQVRNPQHCDFDVFNCGADGICALHQLRLAEPRTAQLVTGVKRDIQLLSRLLPSSSEQAPLAGGDRVCVLDVSLDSNLQALKSLLQQGVSVTYFDHHS